jgi:tRNA(Arg) A34 adenosine deaminase TadA
MVQVSSRMRLALAEAERGAAIGEVPVGAVVIDRASGRVLAADHNRVEAWNDPTAHAEILVIKAAARLLGSARLERCELYVTLEPCTMCAGAMSLARIHRLVFGAYDPKGGGVEHGARFFDKPTCHHRPEVIGGVEETACSELLRRFFWGRR